MAQVDPQRQRRRSSQRQEVWALPVLIAALGLSACGEDFASFGSVQRAEQSCSLGLPTPIFSDPPEALASYAPQTSCDPKARPGVEAFRDLLLATFPCTRNGGIVRECSVGGTSEHKEGRAIDWMVDVGNPAADELLTWLLGTDAEGNEYAMARRLGVMYIVWNRKIWGAYRSAEGWRAYSGDPHTDHIHISFSWAGARKETSFWTVVSEPGGGCDTSVAMSCGGAHSSCVDGKCAYCPVGMWNCDGVGACECGPNMRCEAGKCVGGGPTCSAHPEVCNGLDDDCDGVADNGNPGGGAFCLSGEQGVCGYGVTRCENGAITCVPNREPSGEVCNGLDDNCNGEIDEGLDCKPDCEAQLEYCNGRDDDCDGLVDEGSPEAGQVCSPGDGCPVGKTVCLAGKLVCEPTRSAEVCDGLDNDCNGVVDDVPGGCSARCQPSVELCNGLDDDCDGFPDEDNPEGGTACSISVEGRAQAGVTACIEGKLVCWPFATSGAAPRTLEASGCSIDAAADATSWGWLLVLVVLWPRRRQ